MRDGGFQLIGGAAPRYEWQRGRLRAAFTLRAGGVSEPPYGSLNLALHVGDEERSVAENRRRVVVALDLEDQAVRTVSQVHGTRVVAADAVGCEGAGVPAVEADGIVLRPGAREAAAVLVADCLPLVFAGRDRAAVVHAGWRGIAGGIVERALERVGTDGTRVAVGPSIGPCCFEVGEDVAARVSEQSVSAGPGGRPHVDLREEVRIRLAAAGVPVDVLEVCTCCDERCFSHRRATRRERQTSTGRQAAIAWFTG